MKFMSGKGWAAGIASVLVVLGFVCAISVRPALADTVIDPQIYVCTGCTAPPGGDPNVIDPNSINIGFAGNHTAVAPLLVIVGVPNAGAAPTISLHGGLTAAASGTYYGLKVATSGTTASVLENTLTSGQEAFTQSGLNGGANSELFANWDTYDTAHGISDGGKFNLYAYAINVALNSGSGGNSPINIGFSGIAAGSFVIAYNCGTAGPTCSGGDVGATPFTNAGVPGGVVPEPTTLTLFGSGLLGLAGLIRRRRQVA